MEVMANTFGYARVSTMDQNADRQVIALREKAVAAERIYIDSKSGKDFNRPQYQAMMRSMQAGDLLYVLSIDRLGRNYEEVQEQWRFLTKELRVDICVIDMPLLDTRSGKDLMGTFIADLVLQILSFMAQSERDSIKKRQAEGIAAAKARGVRLGRPQIPMPGQFEQIVAAWKAGSITLDEALRRSGLSASTFYRRRKALENQKGKEQTK